MAKKIILGLLILAALCGAAGAQQKMAASLDTYPLFKGIIVSDSDTKISMFALSPSFEFLIAPHFTLGGVADLWFGKYDKIDLFYFGLTAHGRYYPMSTGLDKFFLDAGLGFNSFSVDGKTSTNNGGFSGLTISLKAGYKLLFSSGFYVEPSMAYIYAKTVSTIGELTPFAWQPGLNIGFAF